MRLAYPGTPGRGRLNLDLHHRKLEKGESNPGKPANPRLKTLVALAEVLGVELVDLMLRKNPDSAIGR